MLWWCEETKGMKHESRTEMTAITMEVTISDKYGILFSFSSYFSLCFSSVCSQCISQCRRSHLQPVRSPAQAEDLRGGLPGSVSENRGVSGFPVTQFISNSTFSALGAWKWPEES